MTSTGLAIFDTALGACGVAWGDAGIVAMQLPEADAAHTLARLQQRAPDLRRAEPRAEARRAIDAVRALFRGEPADFCAVRLDMRHIAPLQRRIYERVRTIAPGRTMSYGEVAEGLGDRHLARAVGQAMGRNPFAPIVPCHRVLAAGGKAGGFSAHGGLATKLRLLTIEGADPGGAPDLFSRLQSTA
jgi:methylated-DNA-[protein]-cysteine S-methyltransferase